jgi:hypothetical protein
MNFGIGMEQLGPTRCLMQEFAPRTRRVSE